MIAARPDLDIDLILITGRQRTVALARSDICCLADDQLLLSRTEIARYLNLTLSAVSKLVSRGRLATQSTKIAKELPAVKSFSAGHGYESVICHQLRKFGNFSRMSPFFLNAAIEEVQPKWLQACIQPNPKLKRRLFQGRAYCRHSSFSH